MSNDYADLVKWLRSFNGFVSDITYPAADAITALVKERDEYLQFWKNNAEACEAAEADAKRWERNHEALQEKIDSMRTCACQFDSSDAVCISHSPALKAAEAEVEKLKEALRTICQTEDALIKANPLVNSQWQKGMNDAWLSAASIAREALHPFT